MPLLMSLTHRDATHDVSVAFREAAEETTRRASDESGGRSAPAQAARQEDSGANGGVVPMLDLGLGAFKAFDSLLSIFEGTKPTPRPRQAETGSFESAAAEVQKRAREEDETREREKHRAVYGE